MLKNGLVYRMKVFIYSSVMDTNQKRFNLNFHSSLQSPFSSSFQLTSVSSPTYAVTKQSKINETISPVIPTRPILTQSLISPTSSTRSNGILNSSSPNNVSISPKVSFMREDFSEKSFVYFSLHHHRYQRNRNFVHQLRNRHPRTVIIQLLLIK